MWTAITRDVSASLAECKLSFVPLRAAGIDVVTLDASELQKAEGALTCCSLLLKADAVQ